MNSGRPNHLPCSICRPSVMKAQLYSVGKSGFDSRGRLFTDIVTPLMQAQPDNTFDLVNFHCSHPKVTGESTPVISRTWRWNFTVSPAYKLNRNRIPCLTITVFFTRVRRNCMIKKIYGINGQFVGYDRRSFKLQV